MMRAILIAMSLVMFLLTAGNCAAGTQWAVLVGIDRYQNPGISTLNGAVNDARSLATALEKELRFPEKNVLVYTSDAPAVQLPTTANIVKALKYVAGKAKPGDTFILFFSGHGITSGGSGYLLTHSSDLGAVEFTALPVSKLTALLGEIKASHRVLWLDACRNDPEAGRGGEDNRLVNRFARSVSIKPISGKVEGSQVAATFFSCAEGQRAYEWPGKERGFFSYFLEKGLTGAAADSEGQVTLSSLVSYLRQEVPDQVQKVLGVEKHQVPWVEMSGDDPGSWVINRIKGARLEELKKRGEARKKELDRLRELEAEAQAARAKEQAEIARRESELTALDAQIADMRKRLGTSSARAGDSLDAMLAMVRQKEEEQKRLEELRKKRAEEEAQRRAEIERLKAEKRAKLLESMKEDIRKYKEIISSPFGEGLKEAAWKELAAKYPEAAEGLVVGDIGRLLLKYLEPVLTNSIGMKFVLIPAGTFMMGSPSNEPGRGSDETQHRVTISKPFYMQTTEVTQGQWREVMGNNPSGFKDCGDDCPVEQVSWKDCQEFIRKLNQKEGTDKYRLPTEAEWEYACRAGGTTPFCFGGSDSGLGEYAWYDSNSGERTHSVGQKKPNAWGLYDLHGNVWEWCEDWKGNYPVGHVTDPEGPPSGSDRVRRGGSWISGAGYCRSADRYDVAPDFRSYFLGFRLARMP